MAAILEGSNRPRVEGTIARRMKVIPWPGTPLATPEELRLAHSIVASDPVLRVFAAVEWDCLDENGKERIAVIIREARLLPTQPVPADVAALIVAAREALGGPSATMQQLETAAEASPRVSAGTMMADRGARKAHPEAHPARQRYTRVWRGVRHHRGDGCMSRRTASRAHRGR